MPSFRQTQTAQALYHNPESAEFLQQLVTETKAVASNAKETVIGFGREMGSEISRIGEEAREQGRNIISKGTQIGADIVSLSGKLSPVAVGARLGQSATEYFSRGDGDGSNKKREQDTLETSETGTVSLQSLTEKINLQRGIGTAGTTGDAWSLFPHGLKAGAVTQHPSKDRTPQSELGRH